MTDILLCTMLCTLALSHLTYLVQTLESGQFAYHAPLLPTVVAHTQLNTAHTVGSDCGYNPGWCRSHPTVSKM